MLFADDSAHPGAAGGLPEDGLQEQARGRCDENVLAQHGKWPEVAQCLKARGIATLEAVGGQGLGRHATEALDPAAWIRLGFACVLAGDAAGGRASVQTVLPGTLSPGGTALSPPLLPMLVRESIADSSNTSRPANNQPYNLSPKL